MARDLNMVIIADANNAESRELVAALAQNPQIPQKIITPQLAKNIFPIRATPAVGVCFWASDMQGLITDVEAFSAYIKGEDEILAALNELGVETNAEN